MRPSVKTFHLIALSAIVVFVGSYYLIADERLHKSLFYAAMVLALPYGFLCRMRYDFTHDKSVIAAFALLFLTSLITLSWSPIVSFDEVGELIRKGLLTALFVGLAALIFRQKQALTVIIVIATLSAVISLFWQAGYVADSYGERLIGVGRADNPNQAGTIYGIGLLMAAGLMRRQAKWQIGAISIAWAVLLVALILTQSRGAWIGAIAAHFMLLCGAFRVNKKAMLGGVIFVMLILAVATILIDFSTIIERMDGYRLYIWQDVIAKTLPHFWQGHGYRAPYELMLPYGETIYQTHSIYMSSFYSGGIIGLTALLLAFVILGRRFWKNRHRPLGRLALALAANAAIIGAVDYDILWVNSGFEWMLFGLPVAALLAVSSQDAMNNSDAHTS